MSYEIEKLCEIGKPIAMAMLVKAASRHDTLTYSDIARRISGRLGTPVSPRHIGHVVGEMMNRIIEVDPKAPPINALVINGTKKLPGSGADWYIERYLRKGTYDDLNDQQKRAVLQPVHDAIFNFKGWDRVARSAFDGSLPDLDLKADDGESDGKASRFGGPAESEEHRRLKEFVAENPKRFGAPDGCLKGETEKRLESCDEIDVWFMTPDEQLAVEVKSRRSNDLDIQRGLFQCVKYRAVLEAQMAVVKADAKIRTRLVSERELTSKHTKWARQLNIEIQVVKAMTKAKSA